MIAPRCRVVYAGTLAAALFLLPSMLLAQKYVVFKVKPLFKWAGPWPIRPE